MNEEGEPCPCQKNQPETEEGAQAWDLVLRAQGQLRLGGMGGVVGFDMQAVMGMARALGYDERAMALLVPYGERGMVAALNRGAEEK